MLCGTEQVHGHGEEITTDLECPNCALTFGFEHDERVVHLSVKPASVEVQGTEVALHYYECPRCHGNWASEQVLISMLEQSTTRKSKIEPEERSRSLDARAYLKCPEKDCGEMLSRFLWSRIIKKPPAGASFPAVDKCSNCSGVWLDNGELDWLLEKGAKALPAEEHPKKKPKRTPDEPAPEPRSTPRQEDESLDSPSIVSLAADSSSDLVDAWSSLCPSDASDGGGGGGGGD